MPSDKTDDTLVSEMTVLDSLLDKETRLAKKYLLDSQGRLRLYHPVTQRCFWYLLTGKKFDLSEELMRYHEERKCKEKKDCK